MSWHPHPFPKGEGSTLETQERARAKLPSCLDFAARPPQVFRKFVSTDPKHVCNFRELERFDGLLSRFGGGPASWIRHAPFRARNHRLLSLSYSLSCGLSHFRFSISKKNRALSLAHGRRLS